MFMRSLIAILVALTSLPVLADQCSQLPVLFIVQDKSGSMSSYGPNGAASSASNPSKWSIARTVVPTLAQQFSNRFRFGAETFPTSTGQFNCSAPTVVAEVADLPDGVVNAYAAAVPGGGTPTAAALTLAKSHLLGLSLTTPTYVMLITDGLPNCNASLNAVTCTSTTPACAGTSDNHCGFGAIDCLDDVSSKASAAALLASGIKVFVVGFGSDASGNNKTVLDSIAASGGTGSAYSAMNQAELTSVLNQIALNTTTCCNDVCAVGAKQCAGNGTSQTCTYDPATKCNGWVNATCAPLTHCTGGSCQACANPCTPGAVQCGPSGDVQQCVNGAAGCPVWTSAQTCSAGNVCSNGTCGSCQSCTKGATRCGANGEETCEVQTHGCTAWVPTPCASGSTCLSETGACTSCNGACTAGTKRCTGDGKGTEICSADSAGCTSWKPADLCSDFCSGGTCGSCGTACTIGANRCDGSGVETCVKDSHNCPAWGPSQQCASSSYCAGAGLCTECGTPCTQGTKRCAANGATEQCQLAATGCTGWVPAGQCDLAAGDHCTDGVCIAQCHDVCTLGALQCSAGGSPQSCITAASGCTEWKTNPACFGTQLCIDGICRGPCADDEFHSCADGTVCTGTSDGGFCLPGDAGIYVPSFDAGVTQPHVDAGAGKADAGTNGSLGATAMGCGCMSFEGVAGLPLLGLALLSLRRRRS